MESNLDNLRKSHHQLKNELFNGYNPDVKKYNEARNSPRISSFDKMQQEQQRKEDSEKRKQEDNKKIEELRKSLGIDKAKQERTAVDHERSSESATSPETWNDFINKESQKNKGQLKFNDSVVNTLDEINDPGGVQRAEMKRQEELRASMTEWSWR